MLKIKLARFGKRNQPYYRIVVNEARDKRDGSYVAQVGRYAPVESPKILEFDVEAYKDWLKKGAQPTPTVAGLFERFQSKNPFPPKKARPSKKSVAKAEAAKNQPAEKEVAEKTVETAAPAKEPVAEEAPTDEAPKTSTEAPTEESTENTETESETVSTPKE